MFNLNYSQSNITNQPKLTNDFGFNCYGSNLNYFEFHTF